LIRAGRRWPDPALEREPKPVGQTMALRASLLILLGNNRSHFSVTESQMIRCRSIEGDAELAHGTAPSRFCRLGIPLGCYTMSFVETHGPPRRATRGCGKTRPGEVNDAGLGSFVLTSARLSDLNVTWSWCIFYHRRYDAGQSENSGSTATPDRWHQQLVSRRGKYPSSVSIWRGYEVKSRGAAQQGLLATGMYSPCDDSLHVLRAFAWV